jgi:hypothetical protein
MFVDVSEYAVKVRVAPADGLPWQAVQSELTAAVAALLRETVRNRPVRELGAADSFPTDPGTLVLLINARITPAAELIPNAAGYVMTLQQTPYRVQRPGEPPVPGTLPVAVHAVAVEDLVRSARTRGVLNTMLQEGIGI